MPTVDGRDLPASQDSGEELALISVFALCCEGSEILTQYNEELSQRGTRELVSLVPKCASVRNCTLHATVL